MYPVCVCMCVRACVHECEHAYVACVCVRACVCTCVRLCMHACVRAHACTFPQDTHFHNIKIDLKKIRYFLKTLINILSIVKLFSKRCIKNLNALFLPKNEHRKTALC